MIPVTVFQGWEQPSDEWLNTFAFGDIYALIRKEKGEFLWPYSVFIMERRPSLTGAQWARDERISCRVFYSLWGAKRWARRALRKYRQAKPVREKIVDFLT